MVNCITRQGLGLLTICLVLGLLASCAQRELKPTLAESALQQATQNSASQPNAPDFVDQALLQSHTGRQQNPSDDKRFDISVNNIPAKTFFLGLVGETDVNVVTHPDLDGRITLELKKVTVQDALDVVRDVYGYEYKWQNGIYTIYPRALRTEVFPVDYIDVKRVGITDTNVSIGQGQSSGGQGSNNNDSGGGQANQSANILAMGADDEGGSNGQGMSPGARVQTLNRTDFWPILRRTVESMVSAPKEGRNVMVNPQSGLVVVTAMPDEIHAVRQFLEKSQLSVKRQVILEAQIVEVRLNTAFEAGINWNAIQGQLHYSNNVTESSGLDITQSVTDGPEVFASIFKVLDVRDLLSLLETQGNVQVLSSPRVSTVNNQKAVIRVGSDEYFVTGVRNNTTSNASSTVNSPELELASFFSGISLDVTPQISADGDVILHIHPIVSEVTDQIKEVTVGDSKFTLPLALRDIRESDSIVQARSGQVIVLGGLMQESRQKMDGKRPWLGDIPGLNALFRTKTTASRKTELVILLRPIVVGADTWSDQIRNYRDRSRTMGEFGPGR